MPAHDYNRHEDCALSAHIFETLLDTAGPDSASLAEIALALRQHLWESSFRLQQVHSFGSSLADYSNVQEGTACYAEQLKILAAAYNLISQLRKRESEFRKWLAKHGSEGSPP